MADGKSKVHRKMVISSEETEAMIARLAEPPFNLSRSGAFRVGIKFLHDYLVDNKLPDDGQQIEEDDDAEPAQG